MVSTNYFVKMKTSKCIITVHMVNENLVHDLHFVPTCTVVGIHYPRSQAYRLFPTAGRKGLVGKSC